ncbi:hypothetical protein COZ26_00645 [Candidatus Kuenenbacteria bacterium CG_4_10_14_3_um_filter_39_14]|uniref:Uncharacterized protein n=1 Tax=Candidatus Kuenenbacteria bacterium CG_4_10_14_3_um_filter_39_14 TaxID=1974614 RepID=A0A2M7MHU5_9BACT|nr:MAG: hypothetical protein COZ26_00645 [Candidatus Kuenenbacteria bacterium CG_4_10_14_3_um_filter_39_14]
MFSREGMPSITKKEPVEGYDPTTKRRFGASEDIYNKEYDYVADRAERKNVPTIQLVSEGTEVAVNPEDQKILDAIAKHNVDTAEETSMQQIQRVINEIGNIKEDGGSGTQSKFKGADDKFHDAYHMIPDLRQAVETMAKSITAEGVEDYQEHELTAFLKALNNLPEKAVDDLCLQCDTLLAPLAKLGDKLGDEGKTLVEQVSRKLKDRYDKTWGKQEHSSSSHSHRKSKGWSGPKSHPLR